MNEAPYCFGNVEGLECHDSASHCESCFNKEIREPLQCHGILDEYGHFCDDCSCPAHVPVPASVIKSEKGGLRPLIPIVNFGGASQSRS